MNLIGPAKRMTIYVGDSDQWEHGPLYMAILTLLKKEGLAGATVTRGLAGYGAESRMHTASLLRLSSDLPLVITVVDRAEALDAALPALKDMVSEGLITLEEVLVVHDAGRGRSAHSTPVGQVMTIEVTSIAPDTPLPEVVRLLVRRGVKAVPVVTDDGRVLGIITGGDLLERAGMPLRLSLQASLSNEELAALLQEIASSGRTAGDVMTPDPLCVRAETTVGEAGRLMIEHRLKRLPVLDPAGRLIGIIGRLDVLRTLAGEAGLGEAGPAVVIRPALDAPQTAGEIAVRNVPQVRPDTPLDELVRLLVASPYRRVFVNDEQGQVLGLVTDAALLEATGEKHRPGLLQALAARLHWSKLPDAQLSEATCAADVMMTELYGVPEDASLAMVLEQMLKHQVKRLSVIDEKGQLVGLVERQTLLQALIVNQA